MKVIKYYEADALKEKTSQLPGINSDEVIPSNPQMISESFSEPVEKENDEYKLWDEAIGIMLCEGTRNDKAIEALKQSFTIKRK